MNVNIISGNLTKDPELKYGKSGKAFVNFTVAVYESKEHTNFINCTAFDKVAERMHDLTKGKRVTVEGKIHQSTYEDKQGNKRNDFKINAHNVEWIMDSGQKTNVKKDNSDMYKDTGFDDTPIDPDKDF